MRQETGGDGGKLDKLEEANLRLLVGVATRRMAKRLIDGGVGVYEMEDPDADGYYLVK
jgi:hypothetical protein